MLTLKEIQAIRFAINNEPEPLRESPQNRAVKAAKRIAKIALEREELYIKTYGEVVS